MCIKKAKSVFLTQLRDKKTDVRGFRIASEKIAQALAVEALEHIPTKNISINTPVAQAQGIEITENIVLVPILRSGIALLSAFLENFPKATVGIVGLKRDEKTAQANWYYKNLPPIKSDSFVIVLDPMIATGGTGYEVLNMLKEYGIAEKNILFVSVVCAPEGLKLLKKSFPSVTFITAACDTKLNAEKFIVPGLGDFGDRYFGTIE